MHFTQALLSTALLAPLASAGIIYRDTSSATSSTCTAGTQNINGRTCTLSCGLDRPGGDYGSVQTQSWQGCIQACAADSKCVTAQYSEASGFCYLKNVVNGGVSNSGVDTVDCSSTTTTTTTTTSAPTCTATTRTINSRVCNVSCGTDRVGGDYGNSRTASLEACIQACAADSKCVTAQYNENNYYCYFKSVRNTATSAAGVDTIDCDPPTCPFYPPSTGTLQASGSHSFTVYDNTFWNNYAGSDLIARPYVDDQQDCANACGTTSACKAFNYYKETSPGGPYCELFGARAGGYCWGGSTDFVSGSEN